MVEKEREEEFFEMENDGLIGLDDF